MAAKIDFEEIKSGETFDEFKVQVVEDGVALDLTNAIICGQLKENTNSSAAYEFIFDMSEAANGWLIIREFKLNIRAARYNYDIKITKENGYTFYFAEGIIPVIQPYSIC